MLNLTISQQSFRPALTSIVFNINLNGDLTIIKNALLVNVGIPFLTSAYEYIKFL